MSDRPLSILVDMDDTIVNYAKGVDETAASLHINADELKTHEPSDRTKFIWRSVIWNNEDWWVNLEVLELGHNLVNAIKTFYNTKITFITKSYYLLPAKVSGKIKWLENYCKKNSIPIDMIIHTGKRDKYVSDVLIDNDSDNCLDWLETNPKGFAVCVQNRKDVNEAINNHFAYYNGANIDDIVKRLKKLQKDKNE